MVHVSGVSREKSSERGHGSVDVGVVERTRGAFWDRARAVGGGICAGGERRLACVMLAAAGVDFRCRVRVNGDRVSGEACRVR